MTSSLELRVTLFSFASSPSLTALSLLHMKSQTSHYNIYVYQITLVLWYRLQHNKRFGLGFDTSHFGRETQPMFVEHNCRVFCNVSNSPSWVLALSKSLSEVGGIKPRPAWWRADTKTTTPTSFDDLISVVVNLCKFLIFSCCWRLNEKGQKDDEPKSPKQILIDGTTQVILHQRHTNLYVHT